jgi:hypothetical protein
MVRGVARAEAVDLARRGVREPAAADDPVAQRVTDPGMVER